jgi:hypothetical protein
LFFDIVIFLSEAAISDIQTGNFHTIIRKCGETLSTAVSLPAWLKQTPGPHGPCPQWWSRMRLWRRLQEEIDVVTTRSINRLWCTIGLALVLAAETASASALARLFAPEADLWERWTAHDPASTATIEHDAWSAWLREHVDVSADGINRLNYAGVSAQARSNLDDYVEGLASKPISGYSRAEQLAYWINLYNAVTVQVVLDHYPVDSIRDIDISPGLFASGPWGKQLIRVEGVALTLNDIEHRILRPIWQDPRIHYAVNCASIACPNLQTGAFTAANTDALMDLAARDYVNHPRGVSVIGRELRLSSIYNWFVDDFDADGGVIAHLSRYAAPDLRSRLESGTVIDDYVYDWRLNDSVD